MIATDNHQRHPVMRTRMVDVQKGTERIIRNMKAADRAAAGLMWIKEQGLEARLVKYVPTNISPANRLLVARQSAASISEQSTTEDVHENWFEFMAKMILCRSYFSPTDWSMY